MFLLLPLGVSVFLWLAITLMGANLFLFGRLWAQEGMPRSTTPPPKPRLYFLSKAGVAASLLFFALNQGLLHLPFDLIHATALSGCILAGYVSFKSRAWASASVREPWGQTLNRQISPWLQIAERHHWPLADREALLALGARGGLQFDGADYDLWVSTLSDWEVQLQTTGQPLGRSGEPHYDRICARKLNATVGGLAGSDDLEGLVTKLAREYDLSDFDHIGMERLTWLAEALRNQWGLEKLYAS